MMEKHQAEPTKGSDCRRQVEFEGLWQKKRALNVIRDNKGMFWVLPPFSNSWMLILIWLYIALNRTP